MLFLVKHLKKSVTKSDEETEKYLHSVAATRNTENILNKKYFQ